MIYSCFNEKAGHYEYFEDDRALAVNGDFPVPQLQRLQAGRVGVPARDAGRVLPSGAKRAGTGWQARGVIVQCKPQAMRGLSGLGAHDTGTLAYLTIGVWAGVGGVSGAAAAYLGEKEAWHGGVAGAIAGAVGGMAASAATMDMESRELQQSVRLAAPVAAGASVGYLAAKDR